MDQKESEIKFTLNSAPQEDDVDDEEDLLWERNKRNPISRWFKVPETIPYSWIVMGCLILFILIFLILPKSKGKVGERQFLAMEAQIKRLEERIAKIEGVEEKITRIGEQTKGFEQFKTRFDRQQASLTSRLNSLAGDMNRLQKKVAESRKAKVEPAKAEKTAAGITNEKYHTVSSGETLYSIGRQYGLTVEKIRLMNKLADNAAIHPGQKLLVKP